MGFREWSKSEVEYGRKVLGSGLEGARSGREAFLNGRPLNTFLSESVREALKPAALGVFIGFLSSYRYPGKRQRSIGTGLGISSLYGAIGFVTGFAWASRRLTANMAYEVRRNVDRTRDEHWLEENPIDYA
ncbi:MAG: hypothetical protein WAM71_19700 [Candidatus Korobacteraceae bacterium]